MQQRSFSRPMMDASRKYVYESLCDTEENWCDKCDEWGDVCGVCLCSYAFEVSWIVGDLYRRNVDHDSKRHELIVPDGLIPWREEFLKE